MKINLTLERIDNKTNLKEQKLIPIDIPEINDSEWNLLKTEIVKNNEKISEKSQDFSPEPRINNKQNQDNKTSKPLKHIVFTKSKLFRKDDKIQIAYIYDKQTIDFNTIFITPTESNLFFAHVRKIYGSQTKESTISSKDSLYYTHWDNLMKERYMAFSNQELIFDSVEYTNLKTKAKTIIKNVQKEA